MDKKTVIMYTNLMNQIIKIRNHNRQGSYKTKERYFEANQRFVKFLAERYGTKKFSNISDNHIKSYIQDMKDRGLSVATIKTDLGAIRFYHNKVDEPRNRISGNENFELGRRKFGGVPRAWSDDEFKAFQDVCKKHGNDRAASISNLAFNEGLRIHETLKIERSHVEEALKTGQLFVKGKGGKIRYVPLSGTSKNMLIDIIEDVPRGSKLFVKEDEKTHLVKSQIQNFINKHRSEFQQEDRIVNGQKIGITFHGLRHKYAQGQYEELVNKGFSELKAREEVSKLLGHERDEVTLIYLCKNKGGY